MSEATNLAVLVPEADGVLAAANAHIAPEQRLTAPAHITLVYPFVPMDEVTDASADLVTFFGALRQFDVDLVLGWFGREVLLLRPALPEAMVDLTQAVLDRWPEYPYYGGTYHDIEPHVSLAFGTREMLEPIAAEVEPLTPIRTTVREVTLLVGPHDRMTPGPAFAIGP